MSILQIHHQYKDRTEMVSQVVDFSQDQLREEIQRLWKDDPPPNGSQFMVCNEDSEYFVKTIA